MPYVNPKICVHRHVSVVFDKGEFQEDCYVRCDSCLLEGPLVKVGIFRWWAVSLAYRAFYKLANLIDKEKK
jgi:hypothetical protein